MIEIAVAVVLIVHGFVHARVWIPVNSAGAPSAGPDPSHSWLLGDLRGLAVFLAVAAAAGFVAAGVGYLRDMSWWAGAVIGSGAVSLTLITLYFNRWLSLGALVSAAAVAYAIVQLA